jgi:dihydrodipicolinate synthase/N-acetylneuraminate lyase
MGSGMDRQRRALAEQADEVPGSRREILMVIPAHPLALTAARKLDEVRQRALTRYYIDAGAGGIAVGVHTTQFEIRDPKVGLLRPVLELAAEEARHDRVLKIAGVCGGRAQAMAEAELAASLGYDAALLSLGALREASIAELLDHSRAVASVVPVVGFYLQPAVGGRVLPYAFWREFAEIERVIAIKTAPFNRYQTLDVVRAVAESGRADQIALYTGNDDNILIDLLTTFDFGGCRIQFSGGLLGHWAVWTRAAVRQVEQVMAARANGGPVPAELLTLAQQVTEANAAVFDPANGFRGCIPGIHEVLRRQGLLEGRWCLDPHEELSPGQSEEIDRIYRLYPHLTD